MSEGARRLRADPHAAACRGLRDRADRTTGADLVVVNTCGFIDAAVEESLDAIGEALAENGKVIVTGCLGAKDGGDFVPRRASESARRHRARTRRPEVDVGGARARCRSRTIRSSTSCPARDQADAVALRVPEDQRGLQPSLHVLHHSGDARRSREPTDRRGAAGSANACSRPA